jgi:hypothetical protein
MGEWEQLVGITMMQLQSLTLLAPSPSLPPPCTHMPTYKETVWFRLCPLQACFHVVGLLIGYFVATGWVGLLGRCGAAAVAVWYWRSKRGEKRGASLNK